jgi:hypothetical protein
MVYVMNSTQYQILRASMNHSQIIDYVNEVYTKNVNIKQTHIVAKDDFSTQHIEHDAMVIRRINDVLVN